MRTSTVSGGTSAHDLAADLGALGDCDAARALEGEVVSRQAL
jgi:hypothetical protein